MGAARLGPCVLACIARLAAAGSGLVGPGAVGSYQGPAHGRRHGGFVRVNDPPVGFFVAGSSIRAMNGLYARVDSAAAEKLPSDRKYHLVYKHDYTGWHMVLAILPEASRKGQGTEWLFVDNDGVDRFVGEGDTLIPAPGEAFRHVHRAKAAQPDLAAGTAVAVAQEDDLEELPWQIIGIGARSMLEQLRGYFKHYRHTVQQAIAGSGLPALPNAVSPDKLETAPPKSFQLPALLEGDAARAVCLEERIDDVKKSLEQSARAGDHWAQAVVLLFVARCHRQQRNFNDAESSLLASLKLKPRYKEAIIEQGLNRLDAERYPHAILSFEVLLHVDREHASVLDWLVRAHAHLKRKEAIERESQVKLEDHETPHCTAWRQTGACDPNGPRESSQDKPCSAQIPGDLSGFCECKASAAEGAVATAGESNCSHESFTCADACRERWGLEGATEYRPQRPPCEEKEPPGWCSANHYVVLGVPCDLQLAEEGGESEELKRAYKRKSLQLHPDKPGGHVQAFQRVAAAHAVLADAAQRAAFDNGEDLERGVEKDGTQSPPHRKVIEKKYFPERFDFHPFGDPHADRKERQAHEQRRLERRRQEQLIMEAKRKQLHEEMLAGAAKETARGEEL